MHWVIYIIITVCLALAIYFNIKILKDVGRKKTTKLLEKSIEDKTKQTIAKPMEEVEVSSAIFNKDAILKDFNAKNKSVEKVPDYNEFEERNYQKPVEIEKKEQETVVEEVNNLSETLKAILFTDVIQPKN